MRSFLFFMCVVGFAFAGPITTVPWNGYKGAVSFTFDDGLPSHTDVLSKMLLSMPDVKVTFFLTNVSSHFIMHPFGFLYMARNGHEIGNHSQSHEILWEHDDDQKYLQSEIVDYANDLEALDPSIKITAFASPYCQTSERVRQYIKSRHFINRDCLGTGRSDWNTLPSWFSMSALVWNTEDVLKKDFELALDTAAANNEWQVLLFHDVSSDKDRLSVDPADLQDIFEYARKKQMWLSTYSTIGAYYRAHFLLDSAKAKPLDDGYQVVWKLPSEHMPESIKVRIRVDASSIDGIAVVEQKGKVIFPEPDSSYVIEFCDKELKVRSALPEDFLKASIKGPRALPTQESGEIFNLKGIRRNDADLRPGFYVRKGGQKKMLLVK